MMTNLQRGIRIDQLQELVSANPKGNHKGQETLVEAFSPRVKENCGEK